VCAADPHSCREGGGRRQEIAARHSHGMVSEALKMQERLNELAASMRLRQPSW
jgi:hypothetical protein